MKQNLKNVLDNVIALHNALLHNQNEAAQARLKAYEIVLNEFNAELQPFKDKKDPILFDEETGKARLDLIVFNNLNDWIEYEHNAE